jgi:predicted Ser/Thr protein kinase
MIGRQIGRYRIEARIGEGGMGVVYRGTQVTLDRAVAIKMLAAHASDGENRERFRREALTLARLDHPNIVRIHDVEEEEASSFIVMEYVGGGSLGDLLARSGPLAPTRAASIMAPVLSALHAAHLAGVVHRDIKPDNILFSETGQPKLTDFGIAHMRGGSSRTRTGVMMGTPYYMSPEQALGRPVTPAADLYAVGVVLYEMLAGGVPFTGEDPVSVALQHVQGELVPLHSVRPELPAPLCDLVHRAMARDPDLRFTSAASMQDALESGGWIPRRNTLDGAPTPVLPGVAMPTAIPAGGGSPGGGPDATGGRMGTPGRPPSLPPTGAVPPLAGSGGTGGGTPVPGTPALPGGSDSTHAGSPSVAPAPVRAPAGRHPSLDALGRAAATGASGVAKALAAPSWRGLPVAFWAGAALVAMAVSMPLLGSLGSGGEPLPPAPLPGGVEGPPAEVASLGAGTSSGPAGGGAEAVGGGGSGSTGPVSGGAGGGGAPPARGRTAAEILRGGTTTRALTPEESRALEALSRLRREGAGADSSRGEEPTPDPGPRGGTGPITPRETPVRPEPTPPARDENAAAVARSQIAAIVARQGRALETRDRTLFLADVHPSRRSEAGELFDQVVTPFSAIRSAISNLRVLLEGESDAVASYDVQLTMTLREDGRQVVVEEEEEWILTREGGRWWILDW